MGALFGAGPGPEAGAGEPVLMLQFPPGPVAATNGLVATAFFLNPESERMTFVPPAELPWRGGQGALPGASRG